MVEIKNLYAFYIGMLGLAITPICITLAYLMEPTYNPFLQTISKLGITDHGQYVFISGTVIGGISLIIFHYYYFEDLAQNYKKVKFSRLFGIISGLGLIGVGIIQDKPEYVFKSFHWLASVIFFAFSILFIYYYSIYLKEVDSSRQDSFLVNTASIPIFMVISYTFLSLFNEKITLFSIVFKIHIIWQKLTVLSFIVWYFLLFYYELKSNENNTIQI